MGASITSFCILFLWFRYQHRRRAAAAAQAQRQFQRLEEISEYDPVVAMSPIPSSRGDTYAIPVPYDNEDPNACLLKPCMVYPVAKPVQATVVSSRSIFPHDVMATVTNTETDISAPTPGVTCTTQPPEL